MVVTRSKFLCYHNSPSLKYIIIVYNILPAKIGQIRFCTKTYNVMRSEERVYDEAENDLCPEKPPYGAFQKVYLG